MKMVWMLIAGPCHDDSQAQRAAQARHDGQRPISASGGAAFQGQEGGRDHIPSGLNGLLGLTTRAADDQHFIY
jgi:hypothetical protein